MQEANGWFFFYAARIENKMWVRDGPGAESIWVKATPDMPTSLWHTSQCIAVKCVGLRYGWIGMDRLHNTCPNRVAKSDVIGSRNCLAGESQRCTTGNFIRTNYIGWNCGQIGQDEDKLSLAESLLNNVFHSHVHTYIRNLFFHQSVCRSIVMYSFDHDLFHISHSTVMYRGKCILMDSR